MDTSETNAPSRAAEPPTTASAESTSRQQPLRIGRVLASSLSIPLKNALPFGAVVVITSVPWLLLRAADGARGTWLAITFSVSMLVLWCTSSAVITSLVSSHVRGRDLGPSELIGDGLRRLPTVLGLTIVYAGVVYGHLALANASPAVGAAVFMLWLIPAAVFSCGWITAIPVAVVERTGVFASLRRSWQLTRGSKGTIFVLKIVLYCVQNLLALPIVFGAMIGGFAVMGPKPSPLAEFLVILGMHTVLILALALDAVAATVVHHDLRKAKEGRDTGDLAAVFD